MNLETEIFKKSKIIISSLKEYGFVMKNDVYVYEKPFLNNSFKAIISLDKNGIIKGKVIDLQMNEEYLGLRTKVSGEFSNKVKEEYKKILIDIKNNCFNEIYFVSNQANRITKYIKEKYNNDPEFLWDSYKDGVFRKTSNKKWYGIIMTIDFSKIDNKTGEVEVMNVKLDKDKIQDLIKKDGYYEAYHMNKKYWITFVLNDTLEDNELFELINESYNLI